MSASPMVPNQTHGKEDGEEEQDVEEGWARSPDTRQDGGVWGGAPGGELGAKAPETLPVSPVSQVSCLGMKCWALVSHGNAN